MTEAPRSVLFPFLLSHVGNIIVISVIHFLTSCKYFLFMQPPDSLELVSFSCFTEVLKGKGNLFSVSCTLGPSTKRGFIINTLLEILK